MKLLTTSDSDSKHFEKPKREPSKAKLLDGHESLAETNVFRPSDGFLQNSAANDKLEITGIMSETVL